MKSTTLLTLALATLCCASSVWSQTTLPVPTATKMKLKDLSRGLGAALAINETYILAGSPTSPSGSLANAGDVQVYRVSDGAFVRRLISPFPASNGYFGKGLAIYGGIAYVGAEGDAPSGSVPESGAVYAFDIATGKLVWLALGAQGQNIGYSLSVSGDLLAAGAPNGELSGQPAASGSVAILDRKDGFVINSYRLPSAAFADRFGYSVALAGRQLAAGAPLRDTGGTVDSGMVAVWDAISGGAMTLITGQGATANDQFGYDVAMSRGRLAIAAPGLSSSTGRVELWRADGGDYLDTFTFGQARHNGRSLAFAGNTLLMGARSSLNSTASAGGVASVVDVTGTASDPAEVAPHTAAEAVNFGVAVAITEQAMVIADDQQPLPGSINKGALWLIRMTPQNIAPRFRHGSTDDLVPGLTGVRYASFAEPTIVENSGDRVMFRAGLKGTGVTTSNNSAVFSSIAVGQMELILRKGQKAGTQTVTALSTMLKGTNGHALIRTTTGGVTTIFRDDGTNLVPDLRVGVVPSTPSDGATIGSINALTGSSLGTYGGLVYTAKLGSGVTAANDSRVAASKPGQHLDYRKEGDAFDATAKIGQISPRLTIADNNYLVFHCALTGSSNTNAAVMKSNGTIHLNVARKGDSALGATGFFSTFLGEGVNNVGSPIIRATTTTGLEGLWYGMSNTLVAVKGQPAPGTPSGVKFNRFTRFFISDADTVLFTATLTGTGTTTANDQGVWLMKSGTITLLLREGDAAPDCGSSRIATISAVDFGTSRQRYSILVTLTGTSSANQALYFGDTTQSTAQGILPVLTLRKGSYIHRSGGTRITSLSTGTHNIDATGSGSKNTARLVSDEGALVRVTYSDAQQELMCIKP